MNITGGINRNRPLSEQEHGSIVYGRNIVIKKGSNAIENEDGSDIIYLLPEGYVFNGFIDTPDKIVLFSCGTGLRTINGVPTTVDVLEIGYYGLGRDPRATEDTLGYHIVLNTMYISTDIDNPISGDFRIDYNGDMVIYFRADSFTPKTINIGTLPFRRPIDDSGSLTDRPRYEVYVEENIELMEWLPPVDMPLINLVAVASTGGSVPAGAHQIAIKYELEKDLFSEIISISNVIYVTNSNPSEPWFLFDGSVGGTITNKTIEITVANLDAKFKRIEVIVISIINGVTSAKSIGVYGVGNRIVYSGIEVYKDIPMDTLFPSYMKFSNVGFIKSFKDRLYAGNVTTADNVRYQKYANNIVTEWVYDETVNLDSSNGSYRDSVICFDKKGFMPGEVYALYIRFKLVDGKYTQAFHIPGRNVLVGETPDPLGEVTDYEEVKVSDSVKVFHVQDTCKKNPLEHAGRMGYWENYSEEYPEDGDEFNGQVDYDGNTIAGGRNLIGTMVKHHRFPSLRFLVDNGMPFVMGEGGSEFTGRARIDNPGIESHVTKIYLKFNGTTNTLGDVVSIQSHNDHKNTKLLAKKKCSVTIDYKLSAIHHCWNFLVGPINAYIRLKIYKIDGDGVEHLIDKLDADDELTIVAQRRTITGDTVVNLEAGEAVAVRGEIDTSGLGFAAGEFSQSFVDFQIRDNTAYQAGGTLKGNILGLRVSNVFIPDYLQGKVQFAEIMYAKRFLPNSLVVAQGSYTEHNDCHARFHAFDLLSVKPNLGISHIIRELQFKDYVFTADSEFAIVPEVGGGRKETFLKIDASRYIPGNSSAVLLPDHLGNNKDNVNMEETVILKRVYDSDDPQTLFPTFLDLTNELGDYRYELVTAYSFKPDIYRQYTNQTLVSTGYNINAGLVDLSNPGFLLPATVYGGDTYLNVFGITTYYEHDETTAYIRYLMIPCYSLLNISLRVWDSSNNRQVYYPKYNMIADMEGMYVDSNNGPPAPGENSLWAKIKNADSLTTVSELPVSYAYNNDYSKVNDIWGNLIFDPTIPIVNDHPDRLYRSIVQGTEATGSAWRLYLPLEYKDFPTTRGEIIRMATDGKDFYVQCRHSLFMLKFSESMDIDNLGSVALGSPELFRSIPNEVFYTKDGYIGCSSVWGTIETPYGIYIYDKVGSRLFLVGAQSAKRLLDITMEEFLKRNFYYEGDEDNPFSNNGIVLGWDEEHSRVLLTRRNTVPTGTREMNLSPVEERLSINMSDYSLTISYYPGLDMVLSSHDYKPTAFISNRLGMFMIDRFVSGADTVYSSISKMNVYRYGCFNNVFYPSSVDILVNEPKGKAKLFESLILKTRVTAYDSVQELDDKTISAIIIYTHNRHSDYISLVPGASPNGNIRYINGEWYFNSFRDVLLNKYTNVIDFTARDILVSEHLLESVKAEHWFNKNLFIGQYFVTRFIIENSYTGNKVKLLDVKFLIKEVKR